MRKDDESYENWKFPASLSSNLAKGNLSRNEGGKVAAFSGMICRR